MLKKSEYMMTGILKFAVLIAFLFSLFLPFHARAQGEIFNIRHWAAPDHTRVVIETSDDAPFEVEKAERKVLIHFRDANYSESLPREIILNKRGIDKIIVTSVSGVDVMVELFIAENMETKIFKVKKYEEKPDRVVIDIEFPEAEKKQSQEREQVKISRKNKIIVIDPGHGGEDPGAVGRRYRTYEKKIVLEISRKLKKVLNKQEGYRAFLTREGDYYVPFKKRLKIAREYGADLFISIHADAFRRRDARGSSVYCLSVRGASSEAAKLLARQENLADIVGGSSNGENSDESDPIVLNLFQTNSINASKIFGANLLKRLVSVGHLKFSRVQEAPFRVLKLPAIPSVLVETAYISNPNEERLLRSGKHQSKIANAIAFSITEFLPVPPSPTSKLAVTKRDFDKEEEIKEKTGKNEDVADGSEVTSKHKTSSYRVAKADTIAKIAKKKGMTIAALLKLNGMKLKDPLFAGRKLKVTELEKETVTASKQGKPKKEGTKDNTGQDSRQAPSVYKVKNGDTLDKIAQKFNIKLSLLLKLNHMKMSDPLFAGQKLKTGGIETIDEEKKKIEKQAVTVVYKVKRGDSLDRIANKYKTSITELRRLNSMKQKDVLYFGKKLKIPRNAS